MTLPQASKPHGKTIRVRPTGEAEIQGIDYGPNLHVHSINSECIVLRSPGHKRWSGVGSTKYESPKLLVFLIESMTEYGGRSIYHVRPLAEISQGRGK